MELRQLRYFKTVYDCGSLLKASELLYISHQALSKSLLLLEKELGGALFCRTAAGMTPTCLGTELYQYAEPVLLSMEHLSSHMKDYVTKGVGRLHIGISGGLMYLGYKSIWKQFQSLHPHIEPELSEYPATECLSLLKSGRLDAAVISDFTPCRDFLSYELPSRSERVILLEQSNPLAQQSSLSICDLKHESFILCINELAYQTFLDLCRRNGFEPNIRRTGDTVYMYELCSKDGLTGISIDTVAAGLLPKYSNLTAVPFKDRAFPYPLALVTRKNDPRTTIFQELADFLTSSLENKA